MTVPCIQLNCGFNSADDRTIDRIANDAVRDRRVAENREAAYKVLLHAWQRYAEKLAQQVWLDISTDEDFLAGVLPLSVSQGFARDNVVKQTQAALQVHELWNLRNPECDQRAINAIDAAFRACLGRLITSTWCVGGRA